MNVLDVKIWFLKRSSQLETRPQPNGIGQILSPKSLKDKERNYERRKCNEHNSKRSLDAHLR